MSSLEDNAKKLFDHDDSISVFWTSLKYVSPSLRRWVILILCFISFSFLSYSVIIGSETITVVKSLVTLSKDTALSLFGIAFTGYAIFQAISNESVIITMLSLNETKKHSYYLTHNYTFYGLSILYIALISFNFVFLFLLDNISFILESQIVFYISSALLAAYISFNIHLFFELISMVYNLFQCFNINAFTIARKELEKQKGASNGNNK